MDDVTYQSLLQSFADIPKMSVGPINLSFLDVSSATYLPLLAGNAEDSPEVSITTEGFFVTFRQPAFVDELQILIPPSESETSIAVAYWGPLNTRHSSRLVSKGESAARYAVHEFVIKIHIYDSGWTFLRETSSPAIQIVLSGMLFNGVKVLSDDVKKAIAFQSKFNDIIVQERAEIAAEVERISAQKTALATEKDAHTKGLAEIQQATELTRSTSMQVEAELSSKKAELAQVLEALATTKTEQEKAEKAANDAKKAEGVSAENVRAHGLRVQELQTQASELRSEIVKLGNDKSLFTEDIRGHFREGFKQIRLYTGLALLPVCCGIAMAVAIFLNADAITEKLIEHPELGIVSLLSSRLPYTTVALALIAFFTKVVSVLIQRVITIHERRLKFSEIGILTKDTSDALVARVGLSEEERARLQVTMRMRLIREYLSGKYEFDSPDKEVVAVVSAPESATL